MRGRRFRARSKRSPRRNSGTRRERARHQRQWGLCSFNDRRALRERVSHAASPHEHGEIAGRENSRHGRAEGWNRVHGAHPRRETASSIPVSSEFVSEYGLLHEIGASLDFDAIRVRGVRCWTRPVGSDIGNNAMNMIDRDALYSIN